MLPPPEKTREGTHKMLPPPKNVLPPPRGGVTVYLRVVFGRPNCAFTERMILLRKDWF